MAKDSYDVSRDLGAEVIGFVSGLIGDPDVGLTEDNFWACALAGLEIARSALLNCVQEAQDNSRAN